MNTVTPGITMEITYTGIDSRSIGLPEAVIVVGQRYVVEPSDEVTAEEAVAERQFQVGDFVKVIADNTGPSMIGKFGQVVEVNRKGFGTQDITVEFAEAFKSECHGCEGVTKAGHGRWFASNQLELVD